MILSIYNEEIDNLDMKYMKYILINFIKNGDVKLENVPRWGIKNRHMESSDHFAYIL